MADVTGPITTLPGHSTEPPKGMTCDEHPTRLARYRVQGETDSMGCEQIDMCEECYSQYRIECVSADTSGRCDWCRADVSRRRYRRDYEEGMCGPVYMVCDACIEKVEVAEFMDLRDAFEAFEDDISDAEDTDSFYYEALAEGRIPWGGLRDSRDDPRDEVTRRSEDYDRALRALGRL